MPWKVYREDGKFCVHKLEPDGSKGALEQGGCHPTAEDARKHQAALYVHVKKELEPLDAIIIDEDNGGIEYKEYYDTPAWATGAHSFEELDAERGARERIQQLSALTTDFQSLMGNIVYTPIEAVDADKVHELDSLYEEFKSRITSLVEEPMDENGSEKAVWTTAYVNDLPDSAFLYVEPGGKKDDQGKTVPRSYRHLPVKDASGKVDAAHLRNAIARANQVKTHGGGTISPALAKRLMARAQGMLKRANKEMGFLDTVIDNVKEFLGIAKKDLVPPDLLVYKEEDGTYGWVASYSNKFMDRDNPPDIIASAAHQQFVEKIDKGLAQLPELHLWHIPEWKIGYATALAYDDSGFPIAIGRFDENKEAQEVAEWLSKQTDFGVSHGMWNRTIQRDPEDPSVIIAYETHEISPLPRSHAANLLADWYVIESEIKERDVEVNMTIPEEKRQELLNRGLPEATLAALEARNKRKAETASAEGVKSKETEGAATETQPVPEASAATPVSANAETPPVTETVAPVEKKDEVTTPPSDYPTRQEIAEAIASVLNPKFDEFSTAIDELRNGLKEVKTQVSEVQSSDEQRIKEIISMTPRDSLASLMASRLTERASSSKQTKVGENDSLLKFRPREEKAAETKERGVGVPFIDKMLNDGKK